MNKIRLFVMTFILIAAVFLDAPYSLAQSPNQIGVVVQFGDGSTQSACVSFTEQTITGFEALQRAGFTVEAAFDPYQGAAVCQINGEGCTADNCFCSMPNYWTYWHLSGGAWVYSGAGSGNSTLSQGDVDGWKWGQGDPPPVMGFDQICAQIPTQPPPTSTLPPPSPTVPPSPVESPSATPTPLPTDLPPSSGVILPTATADLSAPSPTLLAPASSTAQPAPETSPTPTPDLTDPGPNSLNPAPGMPTVSPTPEPETHTDAPSPTERPESLITPGQTPNPSVTPQPNESPAPTAAPAVKNARGYAVFGIIAAGLGLLLLGWALRMRSQ